MLKAIFIILFLIEYSFASKDYVIGALRGQLGNQMFEIASISGFAWDNGAIPYFPGLVSRKEDGTPLNYQNVFFRCQVNPPNKFTSRWIQPKKDQFIHCNIPYRNGMKLAGLFQNENFFKHHRKKILALFAPRAKDLAYIKEKYHSIIDHPNAVGIQVRNFGIAKDQDAWCYVAQYGYDFFSQAMDLFPEDSLFIVSTNDREFALNNVPTENKNVIFLENEPYHIELFLLSMCKHNIISNSSFGWWAAWLNQNPDKKVVAPLYWINPAPRVHNGPKDVWPKEWALIDADWVKPG